jgi:hypothetical protein
VFEQGRARKRRRAQKASDAPRSLCAAAAPCCSSCSSTRSSTRRAGRQRALRQPPWPRGEPRVRRRQGAGPRSRRRWRRAAARSPQAAGQRSRRRHAVRQAQRAAQARMRRRTRQRLLELRRRLKRPRLPEVAPAACAPAARTGGARRPASSRLRRGSTQSASCQPLPPTDAAGAGEPQRCRG